METSALSGTNSASNNTEHAEEGRIYIRFAQLGKGGYGIVYKVRDVSNGKAYAGKLIVKPPKPGQWRHEVDILKKVKALNHPNLLQFVDLFREAQNVLLTSQNAEALFQQCASGLAHLHAYNIIHRDLKPNNILLTCEDPFRCVIADFGCATDQEWRNTRIGSPFYHSPELAKREFPISSKADRWSLGVVILEVTHGLVVPKARDEGFNWQQYIADRAREAASGSDNPLTLILAAGMLRCAPWGRFSASNCIAHYEARNAGNPKAIKLIHRFLNLLGDGNMSKASHSKVAAPVPLFGVYDSDATTDPVWENMWEPDAEPESGSAAFFGFIPKGAQAEGQGPVNVGKRKHDDASEGADRPEEAGNEALAADVIRADGKRVKGAKVETDGLSATVQTPLEQSRAVVVANPDKQNQNVAQSNASCGNKKYKK